MIIAAYLLGGLQTESPGTKDVSTSSFVSAFVLATISPTRAQQLLGYYSSNPLPKNKTDRGRALSILNMDIDKEPRLKKWRESVKVSALEDPIVEDQLSRVIEQIKGLKGLTVLPGKGRQTNFFIHSFGAMADGNRLLCSGFACPDARGEGWAYKPKFGARAYQRVMDVFGNGYFKYLTSSTHFTPGLNFHVSGFVVSNKSHDIESAHCFIWTGHSEIIKRALTTECLIRALGLPGAQSIVPELVISARSDEENFGNFDAITDHDLLFLNVLYCDKIVSGMRSDEISKTLVKSLEKCSPLAKLGE